LSISAAVPPYPLAEKSQEEMLLPDHVNEFTVGADILGSVRILSGSVAGQEKPVTLSMNTADAAALVPVEVEKSISPFTVPTTLVNENEKSTGAE